MDVIQFTSRLKNGVATKDEKIECLNYFVNNYPVWIKDDFAGNRFTALKGINIVGGGDALVDIAFSSLQKRVKDFEK